MTILLDNDHEPYNEYLCAALPEFDFVVPMWNQSLRDLPPNVAVDPSPTAYDAVITANRQRPSESPNKRSIFIQHCQCCGIEDIPFYEAVVEQFDYLVSVSGHKCCTLKDVAFHPKVRVIEFGFPEYIRRKRPWINGRVGVTWKGLSTNEFSYNNFLDLVDGFDAAVICPVGTYPRKIAHLKPVGSQALWDAIETFNVFIHPMDGEQCGLSPMEAMMMEVPLVTGSVPELHRGVYRHYNCFMSRSPCRDSIDWMREKISMLINDQDLAIKTGQRGRAACRKFWSLEQHRQGWLEVLT